MSDTSQNRYFARFFVFANKLFEFTLDSADMFKLSAAKRLLRLSPGLTMQLSKYLSPNIAAGALYLTVNLATLYYQYCYASWFLYLVTTQSGVRKLFKVIAQHPLLGLCFYLSFYFRLLTETDRAKFNLVANAVGIQPHEEFMAREKIQEVVNKVAHILFEDKATTGYMVSSTYWLYKILTEQVIAKHIENLPVLLQNVLQSFLRNPEVLNSVPKKALYVTPDTLESKMDLLNFEEYLQQNRAAIVQRIKREVGSKKRKQRKLRLQQVVERRTADGQVQCLDVCKRRVKTALGCYCESDCGPTFFFGGKSWCYVNPSKCKKGKLLKQHLGSAYDSCNASTLSPSPVCYTGVTYQPCDTR